MLSGRPLNLSQRTTARSLRLWRLEMESGRASRGWGLQGEALEIGEVSQGVWQGSDPCHGTELEILKRRESPQRAQQLRETTRKVKHMKTLQLSDAGGEGSEATVGDVKLLQMYQPSQPVRKGRDTWDASYGA